MAFGASSVVAVELGSNQLRLIHGAVSGQTAKVYDFAAEEILVSNTESAAQQLGVLVARKKLRSSSAALALSGPGVVHRLLEFPPMPLKELKVVVEREMRTATGAGGDDVVFEWEVIQGSQSEDLKQVQVLVAITRRSEVTQAQELLRQCGLKPKLVTTAPISLLRSLKFIQGEGVGLQVILYMGGQQGYLLGVKDGAWSFYREFSSRSSEKDATPLLDEALKEANRAVLYHRQRYREEGEIGFLLCGERGLEDLQIRLKWELGIEGQVAAPGPALDLDSLEERANVFRDLFPSFIIPLGLVGAVYAGPGINLSSKTTRKWVPSVPSIRIDPSYAFRPLPIIALLILFLGLHLFLAFKERSLKTRLAERRALYTQWLPAIRAAEESRNLHESQKLLTQSLGSSRIAEPEWVALFKAISRLAAPDLILQSMNVQKNTGKWVISLKGEVVSPNTYTAQAAFNRFYQGLKNSAYLEEIELLPLTVSIVKEKVVAPEKLAPGKKVPEGESSAAGGAGEAKAEELEVKKTKVEFEVRAQAKEI